MKDHWHHILLFFFISNLIQFDLHAQLVYKPKNWNAEKANLVVVIHGCKQSAQIMYDYAQWNTVADENNLLIFYPQVPIASHPIDCWSWYLMQNQRNDIGQLHQIYSEIQNVKKQFKLKPSRSYVVGISSGAITATGLMACFPNEFAGGALHSGASYGLAQNILSAQNVLKNGPPASIAKRFCDPEQFQGIVLTIHGLDDQVVHPKNSEQIILDFVGKRKPENVRYNEAGGLKFRVQDYASNHQLRGRSIYVEGLRHEWSGFNGDKSLNPKGTEYFSNSGPNATQMMWDFLSKNP